MMNKKELKFYETPTCEVMELEASVALLAGSDPEDTNAEDITVTPPAGEM